MANSFLFAAYGGFHGGGLRKDDTVYVSLPFYHTTGGVMGLGAAIVLGCTAAIRKKFSVSHFWQDCIQYDCTVIVVKMKELNDAKVTVYRLGGCVHR